MDFKQPDSDELIFKEEEQPLQELEVQHRWKVLIVDDEKEIHDITRLALSDVK